LTQAHPAQGGPFIFYQVARTVTELHCSLALDIHNLMAKHRKSSSVLKNKKGSFQPVSS